MPMWRPCCRASVFLPSPLPPWPLPGREVRVRSAARHAVPWRARHRCAGAGGRCQRHPWVPRSMPHSHHLIMCLIPVYLYIYIMMLVLFKGKNPRRCMNERIWSKNSAAANYFSTNSPTKLTFFGRCPWNVMFQPSVEPWKYFPWKATALYWLHELFLANPFQTVLKIQIWKFQLMNVLNVFSWYVPLCSWHFHYILL